MAMRWTDTGKWQDPWFRPLPVPLKLGWLYLLDGCDIGGIVRLDRELADFQIGVPVDWDELVKRAGPDRLVWLTGEKLWVVNFVRFQSQTTTLNRANKAHLGIVRAWERVGIDPSQGGYSLPPAKGDRRPLQGPAKVLDSPLLAPTMPQQRPNEGPTKGHKSGSRSGSGSDSLQRGGGGGRLDIGKLREFLGLPVPERLATIEGFAEAWADWVRYKQQSHKPWKSLSAARAALTRLESRTDLDDKQIVAGIYQSIASEWEGIWPDRASNANHQPKAKSTNQKPRL